MCPKIESVVSAGLCTGCGTCAGICPEECIEITTKNPVPIYDVIKCKDCGLCFDVCPGHSVNFPAINKQLFGTDKIEPLGIFKEAYVGYSTDPEIRKNSSSGGIVTALLLYALENNLVDGAIVVGQKKEVPWLAEPFVAKSKKEVIDAQQSKYTIVPVNSILKRIKSEKSKFAFVGLPCHVHGLRKAANVNTKIIEKIDFIVGIYCGLSSTLGATEFTLRKLGIKNFDDIKKLEYRGGEWPGGFKVTLKNGGIKIIDKFRHNYVVSLFLPDRNKICIDFANDFTDISVGDAWIPELISERKGWSIVLVRTEKGGKILREAEKEGYIKLEKITKEEAFAAHKHMIAYKKGRCWARMRVFRALRREVPDYGFNKEVTKKELLHELLFLFAMWIASNEIVRKIVSIIPISIMGGIVVLIRKHITKRR